MPSDRVLIFLKHRFMGDAILATPLIHAISKQFAHTAVLAAPHIAELLKEDLRGLEIVAPGPKGGPMGVWREAARLRSMRFGSVILVNRSFRSALIAKLARIPKRIGYSTEGRSFLLTQRVAYDEEKWEGECYGDIGRAMGLDADYSHPRLTLTEAERLRGAELLDGATVAIQPGARWESRAIPARVLAEVAGGLSARGERIALIGGPEEKHYAAALKDLSKTGFVDLVGACSLRETMGAISNLKVLVAGDTGVVHIAAALGTPTIAVFGTSPPRKWGYFDPPHQVIEIKTGTMADAKAADILTAFANAKQLRLAQ